MKASIKEVYDGLYRIDEVKFSMCIYGNDHIEYMSELRISRNGFILAEVDEYLVDPVTNTL
jgi:hypothetical protein